jgi:peptide/nickel transport system ATP-binding protein
MSDVKAVYALKNIQHGFKGKDDIYVDAVSNISLEVFRNEVLGIAGESGCGKSTLLKAMYGYVKPPLKILNGSVELLTENKQFEIYSLSPNELQKNIWYKRISYIPQSAMNVLNPTMRIRDHFIELFDVHLNMSKQDAYIQAQRYSENMGLPREALDAFPHQLSGGMKQRAVIAMAVSLQPELILADEPSSALDVITQKAVLTLLMEIRKKLGITLVIVSHDMGIHSVLTDRIAVMYAGKLLEVGRTKDIFDKPMHPYTQALIESLPRIGDKSYRIGLGGQPPDLRNPPPGCRFHPRCPHVMDICKKEEPRLIKKDETKVACWRHQGVT